MFATGNASGPGGIIGMVEKTGLPGELGYLVYVGEVIAGNMLVAVVLQAMFFFVAVAIVLLGPGRYAVSRS